MTLNISHTGDKLLHRIGYYPCESKEQNEHVYYYMNEEEGLLLRIGPDRVQLWNGNTVVGIPVELFIPIAVKLHEIPECVTSFNDIIDYSSSEDETDQEFDTYSSDETEFENLYEHRSISIDICTPRVHNLESNEDQIMVSISSFGLSRAETKLMVNSAIENLT